MYNGSNCDRKRKLSDILKELLNPRECRRPLIFQTMNSVRL